jgi:hypothetical protein
MHREGTKKGAVWPLLLAAPDGLFRQLERDECRAALTQNAHGD